MFINEFHGSAQAVLDAPPAAVFSALTDVPQLPEWNAHIHHVIIAPDKPLREGVEWVIEMRVGPARWPSRAHATVVDAEGGRFEHRSMSDDGNPSYALWVWKVSPHPRGSELTVTWSIFPRSFWRRVLFARLRKPQLESEVHENPLAPSAAHLRSLVVGAFARSGGDFNAGRSLPEYLRAVGINPAVRCECIALEPGHPYLLFWEPDARMYRPVSDLARLRKPRSYGRMAPPYVGRIMNSPN